MKNVEDGLRDIYANGHQNNIIDKMQSRKRLYELVDYEKYNSLDEKIYNFSSEAVSYTHLTLPTTPYV